MDKGTQSDGCPGLTAAIVDAAGAAEVGSNAGTLSEEQSVVALPARRETGSRARGISGPIRAQWIRAIRR